MLLQSSDGTPLPRASNFDGGREKSVARISPAGVPVMDMDGSDIFGGTESVGYEIYAFLLMVSYGSSLQDDARHDCERCLACGRVGEVQARTEGSFCRVFLHRGRKTERGGNATRVWWFSFERRALSGDVLVRV